VLLGLVDAMAMMLRCCYDLIVIIIIVSLVAFLRAVYGDTTKGTTNISTRPYFYL